MGDSGGRSEEQSADRNAGRKAVLVRLQGTRTLLELGLRAIHAILEKNLSTFCPCSETLWEAEFICDRLINLVEEIFKAVQHSGCGMVITGYF